MTNNNELNTKNFFEKNKLLKFVFLTLATLILSKIVDPFISNLYSFFLNIGGVFSKIVSDFTYSQISDGFSEQGSFFILYLLFIVSIILLLDFITKTKSQYKDSCYKKQIFEKQFPNTDVTILVDEFSSFSPTKKLRFFYFLSMITVIFSSFLLFSFYAGTLFINEKIISISNNIEIVAPYISDLEYKKLNSSFHQIETSEDYNQLMNSLNSIADTHSLKLKK